MKIREAVSNRDKRRYLDFIYQVYLGDKNFSDLNLIFVKTFLYGLDDYARRAKVVPVLIEDDGIRLVGTFISTEDSKELKLSFLEFLPNSRSYIEAVIDYGRALMQQFGLSKMIVGVNGQISYGLGILVHGHNPDFEFNANYNPRYYTEELDQVILTRKRAFSYRFDAAHCLALMERFHNDRMSSDFSIRPMDKRHFKRDMLIFGRLCHEAFRGSPYYSEKTPLEMYQLMQQMRFLLKNEDILFAVKDGREVGFIFSHPDYAELFTKPRLNYLRLFIRKWYISPKHVIFNAIGVLPEYRHSGLVAELLYHSIRMRKKQYHTGVSSFILEENTDSNLLFRKMAMDINKEYRIYEIEREA